ncbi:phenylalanine and histidine ammonia-lyase [Astrocystis sublimbata]|nr:phenylalanine and histidine ammonia-lyase [Astrocystis sublimbata]
MGHTELVLSLWASLHPRSPGDTWKPVQLTGRDLTISEVVSIARYHASTDISASVLESMEQSLLTLTSRLKDGDIIYGVNTNFGGSADLRTTQFVELQRALIRELHYGVLPPGERDPRVMMQKQTSNKHQYDLLLEGTQDISYMPRSWSRAAIVIRINSLISGCSAVRPAIVERMRDLLEHDIIPMIPLRGSISASGDLSPLSYICGAIQGKSTIRVHSEGSSGMRYADTALADASLDPVRIEAKEGLAMTNGTAVSAAAAILALHDTHSLAFLSQILTAMSVEALNGTTESFHSFFSDTRPHPGQTECARNILAYLDGSKLTKVNTGANSALRQDRYSIRTVPQWLGPMLEDLILAHQQLSIECNSVTDNPLITPEGDCLHGGNFQAKSVTSAMEKARQATQGIGRMLFSQCTEIINPATNRGLPPNLVADDPTASLIFKGTDLYIAALTSELGFLANPVNHVQTAEMGNQSLNSLALISARYTHTANEVLSQLAALHLITACQALDLRAMHIQFLEGFKPEFEELVSKHLDTPAEPTTPQVVATTISAIAANEATDHTIAGMLQDGLNTETPVPHHSLAESLWAELLLSLDMTASMGPHDRFSVVAKSLRSSVLDHAMSSSDGDGDGDGAGHLLSELGSFTSALSQSLHSAWCANMEAYLAHGDATHVLGRASKGAYTFLRHVLKVPMLASKKLLTPAVVGGEDGNGHGVEAPTVGSYTGAVTRAIRDGTLIEALVGVAGSVA